MTRQLLLLRHAKSSWEDPALADHERPLAKRGRKAAVALRRFMKAEKLAPELVLVSTARRTQETLEALQPWRRPPQVENLAALYDAPASSLLELLRAVKPSVRSVLLIGHNPGLKGLATLLAGGEASPDSAAHRRGLSHRSAGAVRGRRRLGGDRRRRGKLTHFVVPRELKDAK